MKTYSIGPGINIGHDIYETRDGYIITGVYEPRDSGYKSILLIKADSRGAIKWAKTYNITNGPQEERVLVFPRVVETYDGGYLAAVNKILPAWENATCLIFKTDPQGDVVWNATKPSSICTSIAVGRNGGYAVLGNELSGGSRRVFVIKLSPMAERGLATTGRTVRATVVVVDGLGDARHDWPVAIDGVTSGMGQVVAELVEGRRYVARATGLGYTNTTTFIAAGPEMTVRIKIPTG